MIIDILKWWIALEVLGLIGWPIAHRLFAALPSRGYALAKPLGLLLVGYVFWLLGSFHYLMNTTSAVVFVALVMAVVAGTIAWRDRAALRAFWQENRALVIAVELVMLAFYLLWVIYRAYIPEITATEKPMDFMFLNSLLRSPDLPPRDPWLSGYAISYYYFGYLLMSVVARLSGVASSVGFNLALAGIMGLTASGVYLLVYDLIRLKSPRAATLTPPPLPSRERGARGGRLRTLLFPLLGVFFVVIIGNFEGVLEMLNAHGIGSPGLYAAFKIESFPPTYNSSAWTPTDNWWWWRASRVVTGTINEFPFFSFLIADLHPHVMALPFVFMAIGLALNLLAGDTANPLFWLYPILLGALGFLNSWDFPTYTSLLVLAYAINRYWVIGLSRRWLSETIQFAVVVGGLGIIAYMPFYLTFSSQASGVKLVDLFGQRTQPLHLFLFWGFFLFIAFSYVFSDSRALLADLRRSRYGWAYVALWLAVIGVASFFLWWSAAILALLIALALPMLMRWIRVGAKGRVRSPAGDADAPAGAGTSATFALLMLLIGFSLVFVVEFVFIRDTFGNRMNTVFKFYYQSWVLIAPAAAYFVYDLASRPRTVWRGVWLAATALLFAGTLVYPVAAFATRTNFLQGLVSLDGTAYMRTYHPADAAAIAWLKENAPADAVVVEAVGGQYSDYGRVSSQTGIPTLLGWGGHELQWRGSGDEAGRREPEVQTVYTGRDAQKLQELFDQYGVTYVFVGDLEKAKYGAAIPLARLTDLVDKVYDQQGTMILKVK